jgi:hypothetical protein
MTEGLPRLPALAPGFEVEVVAGGAIVSDPARNRAHFLNASAALVLSLCDGASSAAEGAAGEIISPAFFPFPAPITNAYDNSCVYTQIRDHGSYSGTSSLGMCHRAAHFLGLCAAMRYIGGKTVPLYAPLALLMERIAAHFGRFSTKKPANEPTKTQGIDERTQESDERTRDSANEPEVRVVAPQR